MTEMKSIYRKTGMVVAMLALIATLSLPTAVAGDDNFATLNAIFDGECIVVECTDFPVDEKSGSKYSQYRFRSPSNEIFVSEPFLVTYSSYKDTYRFDVMELNIDPYGEWRVMLFKGGGDRSTPVNVLDSQKSVWVSVDVPIPEFATIAIPIVALLGLVAFYRRKQKK